jgi:acetolactate synthase-1/2/3 large subunit
MEASAHSLKRAPAAALAPVPAEPNGSEILVRCLQAENVRFLWGYPGGAVLYIYDALYKQDTIQHVLVRHEQAAVHAADGYARATGEVGVALVTSGPGVTNAVTGIATAYMDSIPLVIVTGQVPTHAIGQDAFQECDTVGITRPCVGHNFVKDARSGDPIKKAFHIARTGGWGRSIDIRRTCRCRARLTTTRRALDALVQPGPQRPRRADPQGRAAALGAGAR